MKKESIKQAIKFCTVGIFNTLIDYVVFYIVLVFLNADKNIAQVVATACAMCGSYIVNRRWTFEEKGRVSKRQIVKFVVTNLISMSCTIILMNFFHDVISLHLWVNNVFEAIHFSISFEGDIGVMLCKILASIISLMINFFGNKFWVFRTKTSEESQCDK